MKVLLVTFYFPPAGGAGVPRVLKLAEHLPQLGIETHVLAPDDPKWVHRDESLPVPAGTTVHRARYVGPRGRRPADELHGLSGIKRIARTTTLSGRRLLMPDENVSWTLTAVPAALRIVREQGIDVVLTSSPPNSVNLIGSTVKRRAGLPWVADLRDSLVAHPHRALERRLVRLKEQSQRLVARQVADNADAIVVVSAAIADEISAWSPAGEVVEVPNGCDFEEFEDLSYTRGEQFTITHAGSFFGRRDPRPFLSALQRVEGVTARFAGDFRPGDREWAQALGLDGRLQLVPFVSRKESLRLQRTSDALLLLIPDADGRGKGILTGKLFEYIAAKRPILALIPPDGEAADLLRQTGAGIVVAPDDNDAIAAALQDLRDRWRNHTLDTVLLDPETNDNLSRRHRSEQIAEIVRTAAKQARRPRRSSKTVDRSPDS
jgi:glycosyltransferase involved in cell wall biosynthesis